jgi:hypothetical protein
VASFFSRELPTVPTVALRPVVSVAESSAFDAFELRGFKLADSEDTDWDADLDSEEENWEADYV